MKKIIFSSAGIVSVAIGAVIYFLYEFWLRHYYSDYFKTNIVVGYIILAITIVGLVLSIIAIFSKYIRVLAIISIIVTILCILGNINYLYFYTTMLNGQDKCNRESPGTTYSAVLDKDPNNSGTLTANTYACDLFLKD